MGIFGFLILFFGVVYGYSRKGTENYWNILKNGLIIGLVMGLIISIISTLIGGQFVRILGSFIGGLMAGIGGFMFLITTLVITIEFIIGALLVIFLKKL